MEITVLIDNISHDENLASEWGLSFHIKFGNHNILLDSGASAAFADNADKLGVDLSKVDIAVLSHAHHDHSDGFDEFCRRNHSCPIYIQKSVRTNLYKLKEDGYNYLGISAEVNRRFRKRAIRVSEPMTIADGVHLVPHTTRNLKKQGLRESMFMKRGQSYIPDDFKHEHSLVLEIPDSEEIVVLNSCSHAGAYNIIDEVTRAFPGKRIKAYLGGLHLFNKTDDEVRAFAQLVKDRDVGKLFTVHCTGDHQFELLKEILGGRAVQFSCGMRICL